MTEPASGLSYVYYPYTTGPRQFTVTFPYLNPEHIRVFVGEGVDRVQVAFTVINATTIEISEANLPANKLVLIQRATPRDESLVTFQNGAQLPASDLNLITRQLLYIVQEMTEFGASGGDLPAPPGSGGSSPSVDSLVSAVLTSPTLVNLLDQLTAADLSAETLIADVLRSDSFNDQHRVTDYRIDTLSATVGENTASIVEVSAAIATETTARAEAVTALSASTGTAFAGIEQRFTALATGADDPKGEWSASYSLQLQGYTTGGTPIIGGIGLGVSPSTGSEIIMMADRFSIIHPSYTLGGSLATPAVPFVVGVVNGIPGVGINGTLNVDGSITADKLSVNSLSALTANAGTLNGGTFKTHVLDGAGNIINPLEFRVEITNAPLDDYPLWVGSGIKNDANAVFYLKRDGSAVFDGDVKAPNITGDLQKAVAISMTTSTGVSPSSATVVHTFTLPAPTKLGEAHAPAVSISVMHQAMKAVQVYLEYKDGGIWTSFASAFSAEPSSYSGSTGVGGTDGHAHGYSGTTDIYSRSETVCGSLPPTTAATDFRVVLYHNSPSSRNVTSVTGFAFGIR